ncbi:pggt1b [Trichonephila clavipes]|nr:pggt1b [Trichonephila clavipes]
MYNPRHYESTLQQGFRYRVLLATKSRRNHRQRASGQRGKVGDDASAASGSAIGYEAPKFGSCANNPKTHSLTHHRSQYSRYSAIYTDGSKRADYVGCGVVIEDIMHGYRLDTSCSIFTAEAVAIYRALQLIDSTMPRKYCIYTDSMRCTRSA